MRMTVTKVKPTVVKHIMPDEVMSIYDIKVSFIISSKDLKIQLALPIRILALPATDFLTYL